jgi:hypothetical protein
MLQTPPPHAADLNKVAGDGDGSQAAGALAGAVEISAFGLDVAADPRGGFALTVNGALWHVGVDGRLQRLGAGIAGTVTQLAYASDGTLLAGVGSSVWRVSPDGLTSVAAAGLKRPRPLAPAPDGGVLVADGERLLRLAPDGALSVLATGYGAIRDAAACPDGRLVAATDRALQEVAPVPQGLGPASGAVAAPADGTLVEAHGDVRGEAPWAWQVPGRPLFDRGDLAAFDVWNGLNYLGDDQVMVEALTATPDGGLLVSANAAIYYVAPARPALLAAAVASARRTGARTVAVRVRLTAPAATTVSLWRGRRLVARAELAPGVVSATLVAPRRLVAALHRVTVEAHAGAAGAAAESVALIAPALPVAVARGIVDAQALYLAAYEDLYIEPGRCRRFGGRRVDCPAEVRGSCAGVLSMVWRPGGHLTWTMYGQRRGHCVVSRSRGVDVRSRREGLPA